jgi:F-type H+-transporting ATPase subunit b
MLELNKWFFVQLANFLLLLFVLNIILFRPMLRLFQEREEHTTGFLNDAKAMDKEKDEVLSQIDSKLAGARDRAKAVFEKFSTEGIEIQKLAVDSAQNEAVEINRKSKEEIETATDKARAALKADIENFSQRIVEKLVGK